MLQVHDERIGRVGHLQHAFASAVIVYEFYFDELTDVSPQKEDFDIRDFILNYDNIQQIKCEYSLYIDRVVVKMLP